MKTRIPFCLVLALACVWLPSRARGVELRTVLREEAGGWRIEYWSGDQSVGRSPDDAPAGVQLRQPGGEWMAVRFRTREERDGVIELGPTQVGALTLRWRIAQMTPSLLERTLEVHAGAARQFAVGFPFETAVAGEFASFTGPVSTRTLFDTVRGSANTETFPVVMLRTEGRVVGLAGDSPGLWENRCQLLLDPAVHRLAVLAGDGRDPYPLVVKPPEDARDTYQYQMDGWQTLAAGETRRFTTWVFASAARHHYDAQVAAHVAVANAKGWNTSAVEAILRNTSLFLLRRNLALDANHQPRDGRYIFISGPGYGWKQWVSDGFYTAMGLDDPEKTIESQRAVFWTRMDYEDNAQYYLIWAVLMKRAGGTVNEALVRQAYAFIRQHETNGLYVPPPLPGAPSARGWKTYHDVLEYDPDDCPASNQGFHCGALLAAKELGLDVSAADIERAIAGYRSLFNPDYGFMPTSRKLRGTLGQDTLYGATLTYAVFGQKLLTDEQVLTHHRTSERVKTPYGLRVISQADGSLLPGHSGVYCFGGSWFLNDAANYLLAGVHGLPAAEVDARLTERIAREIARVPAFNESISTVDGHPHGHILYSWNSGYSWLRREIRRRLGQIGEDPVGQAIDARLGVRREGGFLRLDTDSSTNRQQASLLPPVSAGGEPPDTNYDESKVPPYTLPDPLVCFDGRAVADAAMWRATRRTEILDAFARQVYGRTPAINTRLRCEALAPEAEVFEGLATRRQVRIRLLESDDAPWIDLLLLVPRETTGPAPVFLGLNYGNQGVHPDPGIVPSRNAVCRRGEHARRWPIEWLLKRGYAVASFHGGDLELDRHGSGCQFTIEGWQKGIRAFVLRQSGRTELADDDWGSIGAWAWGLSRALDYLKTDAAVDARRVAVFGHSRTGKTALWAGAQDERFALVISNDSGQGGAALARRRYGETVAASYALSGMWYCRNYAAFGNHETALPVDAHMLIALMAPRPVYVASAELDRWADPVGEFLAARHAEPVYALLGCPGLGVAALPEVNRPVGHTLGYHLRSGDHEITLYDWQRYVDFADRHLRPRRVLYNFDGDSCLSTKAGSKGPVPVRADDVRKLIDELAHPGSRVDTILVCVNAQVMYYPTQVGTMRGALSSPAERAQWPASEKQRFTNLQAFFDNGVDPYAIMLAEAKRRGREALLTFRMNDDHGNDFLRTQFMVDHPDARLGTEPYRGKGALDFGRDEVRDYTFRRIEEAVRRYDCDGLELDFNRFPSFFKDGPNEERVVKMNSLVERIRTLLDRVGDERGHRLRLTVRVPSNFGRTPPTPDSARGIGCDVPAWVRRGWIDWVTVSEFLYERGDLPIAAWKQAVTAVPVYGGIECTRGSGQKNLSAEDYRRAAAELFRAGADGVYLFNFFTSREEGPNAYEPPFDVLRDLGASPSSASAN